MSQILNGSGERRCSDRPVGGHSYMLLELDGPSARGYIWVHTPNSKMILPVRLPWAACASAAFAWLNG
jgi:hypothetical protein